MPRALEDIDFVIRPVPATGAAPTELDRSMAPHPLTCEDLPYEPRYTRYSRRLRPLE